MMRTAGFSLVEVVVAIAVLAAGMGALAQSVHLARRSNVTSYAGTLSTILATEKLEDLRARSSSLVPGGSLQVTAAGFSDTFDSRGDPLGPVSTTGVFVRRWVVTPLPGDPVASLILAVRVLRRESAIAEPVWPAMTPDEARLITVVTEINR